MQNDSATKLPSSLRERIKALADSYAATQTRPLHRHPSHADAMNAAMQAVARDLRLALGETEQSEEELQAVEIGPDGKAYVIGIPARSADEETGHNCDAMRCPTIGAHTLYVLPLDRDDRALNAAGKRIAYLAKEQAKDDDK